MKLLTAILFLLVGTSLQAGVLRTNVTLVWSPPTNNIYTITNGTEIVTLTNTVDAYHVYSSVNPLVNTTNWSKVMTVSGTTLTATLPITHQAQFFVVTASNYVGESRPSNVAWTIAPSDDHNLRLQ